MMTEVPTSDLLGLAGTFPRPGWVVLDAARDQRFTGEIVVDVAPQARVYFDRGRIYLAERVTDPTLGARLVDAGALPAAQLAQGSVRLAGGEHLGRLFERVPTVDRDAVVVTVELMTEECAGWVAAQQVRSIVVSPYRHHPSGIHRWDVDDARPVTAGSPLPPPPPPATAPGTFAPPSAAPRAASSAAPLDDVIRWEEPSWLDNQFDLTSLATSSAGFETPTTPTAPVAPQRPSASSVDEVASVEPQVRPPDLRDSLMIGDWIDRIDTHGLPEPGSDPMASVASMRPLPVEPPDRFEVIWPSGEVDEQFGATESVERGDRHPDVDRAGPNARVVRSSEPELTLSPSAARDADRARHDPEPTHDDVVLAVRRAVASIETSSIDARRRLVEPSIDPGLDLSGRAAVRVESSPRLPGGMAAPTRSVFDDVVVEPAPPVETAVQPQPAPPDPVDRSSALRRLIGSLRRR